ncbi:hypothetical protein NE686_03995 [Tissierella carlieri]|uniref:Restriction endonuclease n=1 Tax=Tissierella carlieri TaxID=689904 RepID=A0ABT1S6Y7_9FIRM|nr:hypothetical protein [Tissierella carlieri]MCQ4922233.1 hypothetical protein [Tissierella carlieri]
MINHSFSKEIIITKKDILPLVYFIISMFQQENTHRQGTSSKSDLIGGYLDRWINKIPENIIFNKFILEDKPYTVVNDYFIYGAQSDKNAPDILGIKSGNRLIKFAEFEDDTWKQCSGMPHIEVKTFRKNQKLVSVRETQLKDDNFYVFVESDFNSDYLLQLFDAEIYGNEFLDKIVMDWDFVRSNKKSIIMQPQSLKRNADDIIGTLKLISIIKGNDIRKNAVCCGEKENMYYIKNISEALRITSPLKESEQKSIYEFFKGDSIDLWNGIKMTPINCNKPKDVIIKKVNKKSLYCEALDDCTIYDFHLEAGKKYKIDLEVFERSSG